MKDKGSLFKKYFSIYAATLLVCTFMLGVALLYFAAQYFREENREWLSATSSKGVEATVQNYEKNGGFLVRSEIEEEYSLIQRVSGALVFFCDVDGRVEICSEGADCIHTDTIIPGRVREVLLASGEYFDAGYLGGFFDSEGWYTYGETVMIDDVIYGCVFVSTGFEELFTFLYQVTLMFLFSSLITLAASFVIMYYATRILTGPLREISAAAKAFGEGDFAARVTAAGNDEIGRLAGVFNRMADSVSELEVTRRSFVANVSHELRTPMTTIAGYIDGILDGTIPKSDMNRYLEIVTDEVKRLARLTSSLLDIARMEAGEQEANITSHNIWDIILSVMWNAERRIEEKGVLIRDLDAEPRFVLCDPDMMHQVIYNLMDNAIKFTPFGGFIAVEVEPASESETILRIRNSGSGIEEGELSYIFERFYKADKSRGLDKAGTGLGLYIVKTLLSRMGGTITAESTVGDYTEFVIRIRNGQIPPARRGGRVKPAEAARAGFIERLSQGFRKDDGGKNGRKK